MSRHVEKLSSVHTKCQYQVTVLGTDPVLEIGTILLHLNGRNFLIPSLWTKRCAAGRAHHLGMLLYEIMEIY